MAVDLEALEAEARSLGARLAQNNVIRALARQAKERGVPEALRVPAATAATMEWAAEQFEHFDYRRKYIGQPLKNPEVAEHFGRTRRDIQRDLEMFLACGATLPDGTFVRLLDARNCLYGSVGTVLRLDFDDELPEELLEKLERSTAAAYTRSAENHWTIVALIWLSRQIEEARRKAARSAARRKQAVMNQLQLAVFGTGTDGE